MSEQSSGVDLRETIERLCKDAKAASRVLARTDGATKNRVLRAVAAELRTKAAASILEANERDLAAGKDAGLSAAMLDRLKLDEPRLEQLASAVASVADLSDPIGQVEQLRRLPNGLEVGRMRVPLGVIAMIYESRPNVTADAAALCLKSGNACVLRGGSEAFQTSRAIARVFEEVLVEHGLPRASVSLIPTTNRDATLALIEQDGLVDLVIPRGGEALIRFVTEHARVPVIQHYKGVCHVYVDGDADFDMAEAIVLNAKVQRPGVCNALETLLVDKACASQFVPRIVQALSSAEVEVRGDAEAVRLSNAIKPATDADWDTEYLDRILSLAIVDGIDGALAHIERHGTYHTEAIITKSYANAQRWIREVDASFVAVNASTRFNDGGELGLGAEIGISTTKLHAYGPMGLTELCTMKWVGYGSGQIRS